MRPRTCFVALLLVVASLIGITSSADEEPLTMRCPSSGTPSDYACLEWRAPLGWGPWGLRIADLSQDGTPEIVVSNLGSLRIYNGVTHAELENVTVGTHSDPWVRAVAIADVDGDGRTEIVVGTHPYAGLYIFEWDGAGLALEWDSTQLGAPWPGGVLGASIEALEVADVDADGTIEIVALDIESGVYVLSSAGDSYAVERWQGFLSCRTCTALAVADVDGDPGLEVLTTGGEGLRVFDGASLQLEWNIPGLPYGIDVGDLNGDGDPEVVVGTTTAWKIVDTGTRSVVAEVPGPFHNRPDVVVGDFDRDGTVEFGGVISQDAGTPGGYMEIFNGRTLEREWRSPNLWFGVWINDDMGAFRAFAGDADSDGHVEVLVATYGGVYQFQIRGGRESELASLRIPAEPPIPVRGDGTSPGPGGASVDAGPAPFLVVTERRVARTLDDSCLAGSAPRSCTPPPFHAAGVPARAQEAWIIA